MWSLSSRGGGKALVAVPLKKIPFFAAFLNEKPHNLSNHDIAGIVRIASFLLVSR